MAHPLATAAIQPPAPPAHAVQFYETESFLATVAARHLAEGLAAGDGALAVATGAHGRAILQKLAEAGVDVAEALSAERLALLEPEACLEALRVGGRLDPARFRETLGGLVGRLAAAGGSGRVRVYGELVDVLVAGGRLDEALELERLWAPLVEERRLSLLCGYGMARFATDDRAEAFARVCGCHDHVSPAEGFPEACGNRDALREVSRLQQRALALEGELARRRGLEEALRRQNEALSQTVRFAETFVGLLGHDLRNPLATVLATSSWLAARAETEADRRTARRIVRGAARMGRMIDQLLDFTRIRLGNGLELERGRCDLAAVARRLVAAQAARGDEVRLDTEGDPAGTLDEGRLAAVLAGLVENALAHGARGPPPLVRIDGSGPREVVVSVWNRGDVPEELREELFEPVRGATWKHRGSSGLGLGSFVARAVAEAHGGSIELESGEGETTVRLRLPRHGEAR